MKKDSTIILQIVTILIGIGILIFMLWEPHSEGRNIHATLFQIYFNDPFLIYAYAGSIPFFIGLYQAFKLLGYVGRQDVFSLHSIKALRIIQNCAKTIIGFILVAEAYLGIVRPGDDIAGGVFLGLLIIFVSGVIAIAAAVSEKILQHAVDMKSENDLTV